LHHFGSHPTAAAALPGSETTYALFARSPEQPRRFCEEARPIRKSIEPRQRVSSDRQYNDIATSWLIKSALRHTVSEPSLPVDDQQRVEMISEGTLLVATTPIGFARRGRR
jgi:hypothetical protein